MKTSQPLISLVLPVFNEEGNLAWHHEKIQAHAAKQQWNYELIYVDDGSLDNSLAVIKDLAEKDKRVHYIGFSRNFGKEEALTAGLCKAKGDVAVCIDSDGQYPLETIDTFLEKWHEGYEIVIGVRGDNPTQTMIEKLGSKSFYRLLKFLDPTQEVVSKTTDFRLIDRIVIDAYTKLTERNRVARNLIDWLGFKRAYVPFHALERHAGVATYSFQKRLKLATDGLIKHSTKPLKFIGAIGVFVSALSALLAFVLIVETYILGDPLDLSITGTGILALLLSFMIGIVLVCQGLLALYLENVYHETQNRPLYVIREEK